MESIFDTIFKPWSWIIAPNAVFLAAFFVLRRKRLPIRLGASILFLFAAFLFFLLGTWEWMLRDGLGPDAIESHGWEALERFVDLPLILIPGIPFLAAVLLCVKDRLIKPARRAVSPEM